MVSHSSLPVTPRHTTPSFGSYLQRVPDPREPLVSVPRSRNKTRELETEGPEVVRDAQGSRRDEWCTQSLVSWWSPSLVTIPSNRSSETSRSSDWSGTLGPGRTVRDVLWAPGTVFGRYDRRWRILRDGGSITPTTRTKGFLPSSQRRRGPEMGHRVGSDVTG